MIGAAISGNEVLRHGWAVTTLGELLSGEAFVDGDWVESKDQDPNGDVRLIQLADVGDGIYRNRSERFLTNAKAAELRCTFLQPGDVLVARMPDPLGRACIFPGDPKDSVTVVDVCIIRPREDTVHSHWLTNVINSPAVRSRIAALQSGSTCQRISRKNLSRIAVLLPPLAEQHRIAERTEALISDVDVAFRTLQRALVKLKRYRQAVLKAAVEGELSREWRETHRDQIETTFELLKRATANGTSENPHQGSSDLDSEGLFDLPQGWAWARLGALASLKGGITKDSKRSRGGTREVPYLRVANVQRGYLDLTEIKAIHASEDEIRELQLKPGERPV